MEAHQNGPPRLVAKGPPETEGAPYGEKPGSPFPTGGEAVDEGEGSELTAVHLPTGLKLRALRLKQGCENVKGRIAPYSTKLSLKLTQLYYLCRGPPRRLPLTLRSPRSPIQQTHRSPCHRMNLQQYRLDPLLQSVNSFSVVFLFGGK